MAATLGEYLKKSAYIINEGNKLESFNQKLEKLTGHYSRLSTFKKASIEDILALRMADGSKKGISQNVKGHKSIAKRAQVEYDYRCMYGK